MELYKAHCSALGRIMAGEIGLTEAQATTLFELENKPKARTEKQEAEMVRLQQKKANPELPAGAKTECDIWMAERIFGRKKEFTSKYTERGNMSELSALEVIRDHYGLNDMPKNQEQFENEWIKGTPDSLPPPFGVDAKCSWDAFTFPLFKRKLPEIDYDWQGQGYMWLTDRTLFKFAYVLINTPEPLIHQEAKNWCFKNGEQLTPEVVEEMRARLTYDHIDPKYKLKIYDVERDDIKIMQISERVQMCRDYISTNPEYVEWLKEQEAIAA